MPKFKPSKPKKILQRIDFKWLVIILLFLTLSGSVFYLYKQNAQLKTRDKIIWELQGDLDSTLSEIEYIQSQPTPTPVVVGTKETNREKIAKIDARITEVEEELKKVNKFLDDHQYNQDAQARRRDLQYELGQLKMERIRYE